MAQGKSVPDSLKAFLKDGVEPAECTICTEPFDNKHVIVQIKECGHHFGMNCLEKWLEQKYITGTCPTCRGVLFQKQRKKKHFGQATIGSFPWQLQPPEVPRTISFREYYCDTENVKQSSRYGFLSRAFTALKEPANDVRMRQLILQAYDTDNNLSSTSSMQERRILAPYMEELRRGFSINAAPLHCPVVAFARTLSRISQFCAPDFVPSDGIWRAIMLFQTESCDHLSSFIWSNLREAAWALHDPEDFLRRGGQQWRILHLFLWLMLVYRAQQVFGSTAFTIDKLRDILKALNIGYPIASRDAMDTKTRVFLSAAVRALEVSGMDAGGSQNDHTRRLLDCNTDMTVLKADVELIWRAGLAKGSADVGAGYPEHWWTGV